MRVEGHLIDRFPIPVEPTLQHRKDIDLYVKPLPLQTKIPFEGQE
jgi:hypothetical protein